MRRFIIAFIIAGVACLPTQAATPPTPWPYLNHPFNKFQYSFHLLLKEKGWAKFTPEQELRETKMIWRGSHKSPLVASMCACVGIMETHFDVPPPERYNNYKGRDYEKARGHLGTHARTVLAEVKRLKLGGRPEMWLALWKRDPIGCDYYGASRMRFLLRIYKKPSATLRIWVAGPEYLTNPKEFKRSAVYALNVMNLMDEYFGGEK